jgi:hypothetical protein
MQSPPCRDFLLFNLICPSEQEIAMPPEEHRQLEPVPAVTAQAITPIDVFVQEKKGFT